MHDGWLSNKQSDLIYHFFTPNHTLNLYFEMHQKPKIVVMAIAFLAILLSDNTSFDISQPS